MAKWSTGKKVGVAAIAIGAIAGTAYYASAYVPSAGGISITPSTSTPQQGVPVTFTGVAMNVPATSTVLLYSNGVNVASAVTGSGGTYSIAYAFPNAGSYSVYVASSVTGAYSNTITITVSGPILATITQTPTTSTAITANGSVSFNILARDATGTPLGAITGYESIGGSAVSGSAWTTISNGMASIGVMFSTPGTYQVIAVSGSIMSSPTTVIVSPVSTTFTLTVTITSATTGSPLSGAFVSLDGGAAIVANAAGVATFPSVTVGTHTVSATASGYVRNSGSVSVAANTSFTLSLTPSVATTYTVILMAVNAANGATIANATFTLDGATQTTSPAGTATYLNIAAGTHTVTVVASGYQNASGTITVPSASNSFSVPMLPVYTGPPIVSVGLQASPADVSGTQTLTLGQQAQYTAIVSVAVGTTFPAGLPVYVYRDGALAATGAAYAGAFGPNTGTFVYGATGSSGWTVGTHTFHFVAGGVQSRVLMVVVS